MTCCFEDNAKLRSNERNLVKGGGNRRPQNEDEICNQSKSWEKPTLPQSRTGLPWYPMQIGYQDIFETTGFPNFSKTLAYSVQCQLNANWYKGPKAPCCIFGGLVTNFV